MKNKNQMEYSINATEMARPFGKRPYEWQRLPKTTSLIATAKKSATGKSLSGDNLIFTEKGGRIGGGATWMHKDIALEF